MQHVLERKHEHDIYKVREKLHVHVNENANEYDQEHEHEPDAHQKRREHHEQGKRHGHDRG